MIVTHVERLQGLQHIECVHTLRHTHAFEGGHDAEQVRQLTRTVQQSEAKQSIKIYNSIIFHRNL